MWRISWELRGQMQCGQWQRTGQSTPRSWSQAAVWPAGVGADGDPWEVVDLLLDRMVGKVEVHRVRGHADKRTTRRTTSKHQRGNVRAIKGCAMMG